MPASQTSPRRIEVALLTLCISSLVLSCQTTQVLGPAGASDTSSDTDADADTDADTDADSDADSDTDSDSDSDSDTDTDTDTSTDTCDLAEYGELVPPHLGSSGGTDTTTYPAGVALTGGGINYHLIVPSSYTGSPAELVMIYSGTEGGQVMMENILTITLNGYGILDAIYIILDGTTYYGIGSAGATVLDEVRANYNIDNDRTHLVAEAAGVSAVLQLGFALRQSYFATIWANDANDSSYSPTQTAEQLGFRPWGNAAPGGLAGYADDIVDVMTAACYRLPDDAPYSGPGSDTWGSTEQFVAGMEFLKGKSR